MATVEAGAPVAEPLSSDQQKKILSYEDSWSDERALRIVKSDWAFAESYRINAHDWRYRNADELYLAWSGQRYWEGTRVPRSSLGVYVVFEQVEAMIPKLVSAVTSTDAYHFTADQPGAKSTDLGVLAWKELVTAQLEEANFREQVRRALKSMSIYGNGVLEVGFEDYEDEHVTFQRRTRPTQFAPVNHPVVGPMMVPTASEDSYKRSTNKERKSRPYARYVSVKDLYIDPNCESILLQDAAYVIKRVYMRATQIKALAKSQGFKIPSDLYLSELSKSKSTAQQDVTKLSAELYRYNMWNPALDYSADPMNKRIAVVEYTTPGRKIWWLQGTDSTEGIIYNQINRYGMINYFSVPYADVLDRWHALSVSDVCEGEQRLQQSIINARIDELALSIHRPMAKRRGVTIPAYQLKIRPGVVIETENPEGDIKQLEVQNITQQAFVEVDASRLRSQRITGITDLTGSGTPAPSGNAAARTATGVNTQAQASGERMNYLVENVESLLIEPVVNAIIRFDRKFLDAKSAATWLKLDPRFQNLDPEEVMNLRVTAECRASIKMRGRMAFLQAFPMLAQVFFNPEYLQLQAQVAGKTLNPHSIEQTLWDALNYTPREPWFIDMSDEQKKAMSQPPPEVMAKLAVQQMQSESDQQINQNNLQTKLLDTALKAGLGGHQKYTELDDKHAQKMAELDSAERQARTVNRAGAAKNNKAGK